MGEELLCILQNNEVSLDKYTEPRDLDIVKLILYTGLRIIRDYSKNRDLLEHLIQSFVDNNELDLNDSRFFLDTDKWAKEMVDEKKRINEAAGFDLEDIFYQGLEIAIKDVGIPNYDLWQAMNCDDTEAIVYQLSTINAQYKKITLKSVVFEIISYKLSFNTALLDYTNINLFSLIYHLGLLVKMTILKKMEVELF